MNVWFEESSMYFCKIEYSAYGKFNERSFSNPHFWSFVRVIHWPRCIRMVVRWDRSGPTARAKHTFFHPQTIRAVGYCRTLCRLSVRPTLITTLESTIFSGPDSYLLQPIDLSKSIKPMDYGLSIFIFKDPVALWNFMNTLTDVVLDLGRPRPAEGSRPLNGMPNGGDFVPTSTC